MLLNFQKRFADLVESEQKTHTIRAKRKRRPKVGEWCHCYTGLRQKGARVLGRFQCVKIQDIEIDDLPHPEIRIDGQTLELDECELLARRDGFESLAEMMEFWSGRLPFSGDIIHWNTRVLGGWAHKRCLPK